ncbi:AraC family transcriptional regulator [Pedobacter nototheniae]|uniref:AraC family transcriptional regulator n=1 Tax=Pedobacter nototheniae TaxID=2488994 RepID=UPI00292F61DC|nr:AraC family transcriptional regulator [Pedobacter nototheniae]
MQRFIQHDALFIRHFSTMQWPFPVHNHNHFELVFIHSGTGTHTLNDVETNYTGPELFLLAPADYHIFKIKEQTEFTVLKFTNIYLNGVSVSQVTDDWNKLIDHLLALTSVNHQSLLKNAVELGKISRLMYVIADEWKASLNPGNQVIFYLIRAVFALIRKNVATLEIHDAQTNSDLLTAIADYIHLNIKNPKLIKLQALAAEFKFSPNYLNTLFKNGMGQTVKTYMDAYRIKLIKNRLKYSNQSIKHISEEFAFSDMSHFNKFVKKHAGVNPKKTVQNSI